MLCGGPRREVCEGAANGATKGKPGQGPGNMGLCRQGEATASEGRIRANGQGNGTKGAPQGGSRPWGGINDLRELTKWLKLGRETTEFIGGHWSLGLGTLEPGRGLGN